MPGQTKKGATIMNRNRDITSDHTLWIKEQIGKGTFASVHGREVWIKVPGRNLSRIVNIPESGSALYRKAWIDVYNNCLDYLEGSINAACLENKFIQRMGSVWTLNGHVVRWPKFNEENANYARGLEEILDEYNYIKDKYIKSLKKNEGISVRKRSVNLEPNVAVKETELKVVPKLQYEKPKVEEKLVKPKTIKKRVTPPQKDVSSSESLVIQKVSDGELLDDRDINNLKASKTDIVVLTCMDVLNPKDEDLFVKNARKCHNARLVTGAFIYGKAKDEHDAASELKIMLKILSKFEDDFSGLVYYSINNDYVRRNRLKEEKLLDFINMYKAIIETLKKAGYNIMLSMDLESGKILSEVCENNNVEQVSNISYMVVVRDSDEVSDNTSKIVVDPWNDFDVVYIKNSRVRSNVIHKVR